jgi:hypothetical protein
MPPAIAAIVYAAGILVLFLLDRDPERQNSRALWFPTAWFLIAGSRPVSVWIGMAPARSIEQYLEGSPFDRTIFALLLAGGIVVLLGRRAAVTRIFASKLAHIVIYYVCRHQYLLVRLYRRGA